MSRHLQKKRRDRRKTKIRRKIFGIKDRPRLAVFRSNRHIWVQLINDEKGETILSASDKELTKKNKQTKSKSKIAYEVGILIAKKAKEKKVTKVVFDRGRYKYHGRVKELAEGARSGGLKF